MMSLPLFSRGIDALPGVSPEHPPHLNIMNDYFWYEHSSECWNAFHVALAFQLVVELEHLSAKPHRYLSIISTIDYVYEFLKRKNLMSRKRKEDKNEPRRPKHPEKLLGWINCRIEDVDIPELERLLDSPADLCGELVAFIDNGFSVGVKWQSDGKSVMAYIIGTCADDASGSVGLSAFGEDGISAVASLVFKYHVKLDRRLGRPENGRSNKFG